MKKNKIAILLILLFLVCISIIFIITSNLFLKKGSGEITLRLENKNMDDLTIKGPFNYYFIDWQMFSSQGQYADYLGGKGLSQCKLFGNQHMSYNYLYNSDISSKIINNNLKDIELEKPYLIWQKKSVKEGEEDSTGYLFIILTKNKDLFDNEKKLLNLGLNSI